MSLMQERVVFVQPLPSCPKCGNFTVTADPSGINYCERQACMFTWVRVTDNAIDEAFAELMK